MEEEKVHHPEHVFATESKRPEDTPFKQQRLPAWQPILTPKWVILSFTILGFIFLILGVVILLASQSVVMVEQRYDNIASCQIGSSCDVNITIPEDMAPPIFFYYQLNNFYQNHRRYVKSRSDAQLRGETGLTAADLDSCDPLVTDPTSQKILYPCGLIANSFFNDRFSACILNDQDICTTPLKEDSWRSDNIAWPSDRDVKYISRNISSATETGIGPNGALPSVDNEEFIVWMRTAGLPKFKKLHRRITDITLSKGTKLQFTIDNNFRVAEFKGEKSIVLSTTTWIGGKNDFLGWAYIIVGIVCVVLAIVFGVSQLLWPRTLGDEQYLQIKSNQESGKSVVKRRKPAGTVSRSSQNVSSGGFLNYYNLDSPGLRISPTAVLILTLVFVGFVVVLHIWGKYRAK